MMRLFVFYCIKSSDVCAGRKMIEERRRGKERKSVYIYIWRKRKREREKEKEDEDDRFNFLFAGETLISIFYRIVYSYTIYTPYIHTISVAVFLLLWRRIYRIVLCCAVCYLPASFLSRYVGI